MTIENSFSDSEVLKKAKLLCLLYNKQQSHSCIRDSIEEDWEKSGLSQAHLESSISKLQHLESEGVKTLTIFDQEFEDLNLKLSKVSLFFCLGNIDLLKSNKKTVGIVGSRRATSQTLKATECMANILASNSYLIVSGLAMGVDAAAHRGAIRERRNSTIAVLGNPLPGVSPKHNYPLSKEVAASGGLIISQFLPGVRVARSNFIIRNRLIADLSSSLIVTEAGLQSGSLSTARAVQKLDRPVFALPGGFNQERFAGSHLLIQKGASPIFSYDDFQSKMNLELRTKEQVDSKVYQFISQRSETSLSELLNKFADDIVFSELIRLKNDNLIFELPGPIYCAQD